MLRRALLIALPAAAAVLPAPALAADVPVYAGKDGSPVQGPPLDFLAAQVDVPAGVRARRDGGELSFATDSPCHAGHAVGAFTAQRLPTPRGRPRLRRLASGRRTTTVQARDGRSLDAPLKWAVFGVRDEGLRITTAAAEVRLPADVAPAYRQRAVLVYAYALTSARCQRRAGRRLTRLTGAIVRSVRLRETAEYIPPPPPAPPPTQDLLSAPTLTIRGARRDDVVGQHLAPVGDVDADGRPDLAVGALLADPRGRSDAGAIHIVKGPSAPGTLDLLRRPPSVATLDGPSRDAYMVRAAGAGDLDGDGIDDLVAGAPRAHPSRRRRSAGQAYLVLGARGFASRDLARPGSAATVIDGAYPGQDTGEDVAGVPDFDGDGIPDVAISAPDNLGDGVERAAVHVVFGRRPLPPRVDLRALGTGGLTITGFGDGAEGLRIAGLGDVNGDGLGDLAIAWPFAGLDEDTGEIASELVVVFGRRGGGRVDVRRLGAAGARFGGAACDGLDSVAAPGDVNGDGHADVLVGATLQCSESAQATAGAYVVFGGPGLTGMQLDRLGDRGLRIDGLDDSAGLSVAAAGDDNGDGLADLVLGERRAVYVVHGRREPGRIRLLSLGDGGRRVRARFDLGVTVTALPDADGDGRAELVAEKEPPGRGHNGGAVIVFSRGG